MAPFARQHADAAMLDTLGDGVGFGPITRRRLRAAAGLDPDAVAPSSAAS